MAEDRNLPSGGLNTLRALGAWFINTLWKLGFASRFLAAVVLQSGQLFLRPQLLIREIFYAGVLSLIIIIVSGLFVGMVLGLQGYNTLVRFGSADALGTLVALSLLRELGPVLAALLFASRSGSAMTAEIGLMKATEQLDAMAVMGVNPLARVIAPRFWAGLFSLPILTALFNVMGIIGGYFVGVEMIGLDQGSYWAQMQNAVDLHDDVINGLIKSLFFGLAVTLIAVFEGYDADATAAGVSAATTRTVVTSALVILAMDFVLTAFMF
ncbi:MAG: lipid asymmetry maintenance ABC transporter permease subunit MlaE [Pseudomonadales bacterium]